MRKNRAAARRGGVKAQLDLLEFFAGGGMVRLGLGRRWRCRFANDFDSHKCAAYRENFGGAELVERDVAALGIEDLPAGAPDLAWASFPCQDLSLAGARGGLRARRSGAFFGFWRLIEALGDEGRAPRLVAIENVTGLITSNGGADFRALVELMARAGYTVSAMVLDARLFTPQSRPRIFIVGFGDGTTPPFAQLQPDDFVPTTLVGAVEKLSARAKRAWGWLAPRPTARRNAVLADLLDPDANEWHSARQTKRLLEAMSTRQRARVKALLAEGGVHIGAAFRRIRIEAGARVQRVEARFDGLAGCLRTPAGGSSRQMLLEIRDGAVRSRLMTPREAARLMGLPEDYRLPEGDTAGLKLCGDGVCVPAVRWLAEAVLEPALDGASAKAA